ncbi:uncharacterized protein LOC134036558, partial [Osmerus eperlanus]|uniref:uncharacterized protein LOC134036558 n=1 Tax=Osmerus eperlanus TaxID=29151 RepID=UPI002E12C05E
IIILNFKFTGFSYGQTIQANQHEVSGEEGHHVTLSCNYSSAQSLLWYKQYPGSAPQFLLLILHSTGTGAEPLDSRLSAKLNTEKTCVELEISSVTVTDSALYYCALRPTVTGNPDTLLLWYCQYPGSAPQFIIQDYTGSITNPVPGLTIHNVKDQKLVELEISSAEVTDSALYYCALKPKYNQLSLSAEDKPKMWTVYKRIDRCRRTICNLEL